MATEPPADAELVAAYRGGDETAAAVLVRRHAPALERFLYSSGADVFELEDLAQETFVRAFRRLDSWHGTVSLRSWLFAIAGNLLRDERRKQKGRRIVAIDGYDFAGPTDPYAELAAIESERRIRAGLAKLPRLQREVFLMRVQGGSGYAEIAAVLGTTSGAVRVHYHHAVKRLKELVR